MYVPYNMHDGCDDNLTGEIERIRAKVDELAARSRSKSAYCNHSHHCNEQTG
jgi:hypothetical protein